MEIGIDQGDREGVWGQLREKEVQACCPKSPEQSCFHLWTKSVFCVPLVTDGYRQSDRQRELLQVAVRHSSGDWCARTGDWGSISDYHSLQWCTSPLEKLKNRMVFSIDSLRKKLQVREGNFDAATAASNRVLVDLLYNFVYNSRPEKYYTQTIKSNKTPMKQNCACQNFPCHDHWGAKQPQSDREQVPLTTKIQVKASGTERARRTDRMP